MKRYSRVTLGSLTLLSLALVTTLTACKGGGNAPSLGDALTATPTVPSIPTDGGGASYALVYGSSSSDRANLADRMAGYQAPGLSVVFSQWRRFSGAYIYNTPASISPLTPSYCFTGFDASYNWLPGNNGGAISPGTYTNCVNSDPFLASSWSYIASPDRIYNAANGSNFNGFISALKFIKFSVQATLYSADADDDGLGIVIASVIDSSNRVHTLTAMRTQGGMVPTQGFGIVYKRDNTVINTFGAKTVGANSGGWAGRKSLVRIERDGDSVKAYASTWATGSTVQSIDPASEISLDLADAANGLSIFQGEQYYGYGTISQLGATFSDIVFSAPNAEADATYLYDLVNNSVYYKDSSAGYTLLPGVQAMSVLGYPLRVKNNETQREFTIDSATTFTEL